MSTAQSLSSGAAKSSAAVPWGTLLVLCGAIFLDALDVSMIGVALPSIRTDLGMSTSALQWVVSGYVLGYGGFLLLGGRAADLFGRRAGSSSCRSASSSSLGPGRPVDDGSLLIVDALHQRRQRRFHRTGRAVDHHDELRRRAECNKALLVYTATGATGFSLGLVLSGLLTGVSWRLTLLLPIPLALITLAAAICLVPHSEAPGRRPRASFDLGGRSAVLTGAMLLLVFSIVQAPEEGWTSVRTLAAGWRGFASSLAAFATLETLLSLHLSCAWASWGRARWCAPTSAQCCLFGSWVGFQFIAVLYMQQLRGWSAIETGLGSSPEACWLLCWHRPSRPV